MKSKPDKEILEELEKFIHENADLEQLENIADEFNIFTALNIVNNEVRHSSFLAWLMNPNESHGLGDYFLTLFLKKVSIKKSVTEEISIFDIDSWNLDDAEILREWRNIDIVIRSDNQKFICIIENKIFSNEHSNQLQRYREIIGKEYPGYKKLFVYLTVEEDNPSENEKEYWIPLSYDVIKISVEHLINNKKDKLGSEILTFISHYKEMLGRYVMQDSKIQEICRKIYNSHKKALDFIFEYKPDKLMDISDSLKEIIKEYSELILDDSSKSSIRFIPKDLDFIPQEGGGWTSTKRILLFEFFNNIDGVNLSLIIGPGTQEIRQKIYDIANKNSGLFKKPNRKFGEKWSTIYKTSILSAKEYEGKEVDEIKPILKEKFEKFKSTELPKIMNEIKKFNEMR